MIYTKEFNKFFESFDTGDIAHEELEKIKIDMYSGWEGRQREIDELNKKCIILSKFVSRMCPRRKSCDSEISVCYSCINE